MKWCRLDRQVALTEAYQPVREKTISSLRFKLFEIIQNYRKNYNYEFNHHWCWVPNDIPSFWFANSCIQNFVTYLVLHTIVQKCTIFLYCLQSFTVKLFKRANKRSIYEKICTVLRLMQNFFVLRTSNQSWGCSSAPPSHHHHGAVIFSCFDTIIFRLFLRIFQYTN